MLRILIYLLLAVLLAPMPYGYYQLVRFVSMVVLTVMAFLLLNEKKEGWTVCFGTLAVAVPTFHKDCIGTHDLGHR